jgi:hypothetical protein
MGHTEGLHYLHDAIEEYERTISLDPTNLNAFYNSGLAFLDLG